MYIPTATYTRPEFAKIPIVSSEEDARAFTGFSCRYLGSFGRWLIYYPAQRQFFIARFHAHGRQLQPGRRCS